MTRFLAALTASTFIAGAAHAAPVHVDLTSGVSGIGTGSGTFSQSGISGTVYADSYLGHAVLTQSGHGGLGVKGNFLDLDGDIDGFPGTESISLVFDEIVSLFSIELGHVDSTDNWDVAINLADGTTSYYDESSENPFMVGGSLATGFSLRADAWLNGFRLKGFTAETMADTAPVPLPAGILLLPAALAGLYGIRRKQA